VTLWLGFLQICIFLPVYSKRIDMISWGANGALDVPWFWASLGSSCRATMRRATRKKPGDLLAYKVVGNFPSSPQKFPTSPSYLPHQYILPFWM